MRQHADYESWGIYQGIRGASYAALLLLVVTACGEAPATSALDTESTGQTATTLETPATSTTSAATATTAVATVSTSSGTPSDDTGSSTAEESTSSGSPTDCLEVDVGPFVVAKADGSFAEYRASLAPNVGGSAPDPIGLQLHAPTGGIGTVELGEGVEANYETCTNCIIAQLDVERLFFQTGGTVDFTDGHGPLVGWVSATVSDLTLAEVSVNVHTHESTLIEGGDCLHISSADILVGDSSVCSCDNQECGDDGCGNSCGTCDTPLVCDAQGQCICVPVCGNAECGDDSCGGTCGTCGVDEVCEDGVCLVPPCGPEDTGTCVEQPPKGWSGPVVVYEGDGPIPECPDDYPDEIFTGYGELDCGESSCSACECSGTPEGGYCSSTPNIYVYANDDCTGFYYHFDNFTDQCFHLLGTAHGDSARAHIDYAIGTSCGEPSGGGELTADTPAWGFQARVCGAPLEPQGCNATDTCIEAQPDPFEETVCVVADGIQECPEGSPYSVQHVYYSEFEDTRGCTEDCSCSASGKRCGNTVELLHTSQSCFDQGQEVPADGMCHAGDFSSIGHYDSEAGPPVEGTGTCSPAGAVTPTGACGPVEESGTMTACCLE
jgi:hypothetical protein